MRDWGKGIPPEKQHLINAGVTIGIGIGGMRERIRQLGGSLKINSGGDGAGTVIVARLFLTCSTFRAAALSSVAASVQTSNEIIDRTVKLMAEGVA